MKGAAALLVGSGIGWHLAAAAEWARLAWQVARAVVWLEALRSADD